MWTDRDFVAELPSNPPWWLDGWARFHSGLEPVDGVREAQAAGASMLSTGALLIAAHGSTYVTTPQAMVDELHRLVRVVQHAIEVSPADGDDVARWVQICADQLALLGDQRTYHDPRNSYLPDIIRRRQSLPIGLALVWLQVAESLHLPAYGVGMPGHFLVGVDLPAQKDPTYIDCFGGGITLSMDEAEALYERMFSGRVHPPFDEDFLAPVSDEAMFTRMLTNLKQHAARRRDLVTLCDLGRLRWFLPDQTLDEARELIRLCAATGMPGEAQHWLRLTEQRWATSYPEAQLAGDRRVVTAGLT
jgi:regulator of sirC expression with transglutaminase-like and TPR domain